jgi:DNA-binding LytR/AlgR family response regulator
VCKHHVNLKVLVWKSGNQRITWMWFGMLFPVIQRNHKNDKGSRYMLSVEDVLFVSVDQTSVLFHTVDRQFFLKSILEEWKIILEGYGFEEMDRGVLANMKKAQGIHTSLRRIYFEKDLSGAYCTISASKLKTVMELYPKIQFIKNADLYFD